MKRHTLGPWGARGTVVRADNGEGALIAELGKVRDVNLANAALIAAAPEMLQALKDLLHVHETKKNLAHDVWEAAREAIAKAEP
jgi:hypothetical protein